MSNGLPGTILDLFGELGRQNFGRGIHCHYEGEVFVHNEPILRSVHVVYHPFVIFLANDQAGM